MEIRWFGNNCFTLKGAKAFVAIDPGAVDSADIVVTTSDDNKLPSALKSSMLFDWPGEYESRGVMIQSIALEYGKDEKRICSVELDGIRIANLGTVTTVPSEEMLSELGNVDILMVPLTLKTKDIIEVIEEVDPRLVIFSMFGEDNPPIAGILKELGKAGMDAVPKIVIKNKSEFNQEVTEYAYLSV